MSETLNNVEIFNLLNTETPKIDPAVRELIRDLYVRVTELEAKYSKETSTA